MAFWTRMAGRSEYHGEVPNTNGPAGEVGAGAGGGDPHGVEVYGERALALPLANIEPSPWAGWPTEWGVPNWSSQNQITLANLIDVAWAAIDLNASVLSSFPAYRLKSGRITPPPPWLINPDDRIYSSWAEFAKQVFWDFQLGEAFILPFGKGSDGYANRMRVVPPWLINVDLDPEVGRRYTLGSLDVTDSICHIRNISSTADARGHCPLEAAGARMITAGLLQKYAAKLAETGGTPTYWIGVDRTLTKGQADDLLDQWVESRKRRMGEPALLTAGGKLNQTLTMSAKDMALLELAQFNEARVAILCGVPPFLLGLPMAQGESITYSNAESIFDFHDRSSLKPKATHVMQAISYKFTPYGTSIELNRDEYSRPGYLARAQANHIYYQDGVLDSGEIRSMERFEGDGPTSAPAQITGDTTGTTNTTTTTTSPPAAPPARVPVMGGTT